MSVTRIKVSGNGQPKMPVLSRRVPPVAVPDSSAPASVAERMVLTDEDFATIRTIAYRHAGLAIADFKKHMVLRRIAVRLKATGLASVADYCDFVASGAGDEEVEHLVNALTTNKTSFFRDAPQFDHLRRSVLPKFLRTATSAGRRRLRIWSAGCSTGEEAWSIAITLASTPGLLASCDIRILASDVDSEVLSRAESAVYPIDDIARLPLAQRRWFRAIPGRERRHAVVADELRRLVRFNKLNIHEPWPFSTRFDVIFCRNVFIYFDKPSQQRLMDRFAEALNEDGIFYAGHSECLNAIARNFQLCGHSIYQRL